MAVLNAQYKQPNSAYSQGLKDLIDAMLKVDPKQRPDIHQVSIVTSFLILLDLTLSIGFGYDRSRAAIIALTLRLSQLIILTDLFMYPGISKHVLYGDNGTL